MNEITYDELITSVNTIITEANVRYTKALQGYDKKIQDHIQENLSRIIDQTAEINEQNKIHARVHNACILYAAGNITTERCVSKVIEFERIMQS